MAYLDELDKLVDQQEAKFVRVYQTWVKERRSDAVINELTRLLEAGRIEEALDLITEGPNPWPLLFLQMYIVGGIFQSNQTTFIYQFNPLTTNFAREQADFFSNYLSSKQRESLRIIAYQGYVAGQSWQEIAKTLKNYIGLNDVQQRALTRYKKLLETQDLSDAEIRRMTNAKRERMIESRAKTMARGQVGALIEDATETSYRQGLEAEELDANLATKTWHSMGDDKVRFTHTHSSLDGQTVPIDQPFVSISGARLLRPHDTSLGAPLSETVNCRCRVTFQYPESP